MPTLSDNPATQPIEARSGDWTARLDKPRQSVFGNFKSEVAALVEVSDATANSAVSPLTPALSLGEREKYFQCRDKAKSDGISRRLDQQFPLPEGEGQGEGERDVRLLQVAIDSAIARSYLHRFLAQAYEDPTPEGWRWLTGADTLATLRAAVATLMTPGLEAAAHQLAQALTPDAFESYSDTHRVCFGHAARGSCPLNEIEYGDIKADGLFQPHRLADLAAFYRAFGLDVADDATERQDHICLELEFMTVLAAKEAYALEHQLDASELALCRDAQKKFLREHLGRWTPGFARRLARMADGTPLAALAAFTRAFIESECARFHVPAGSEDLLLRPVDEAAESLCASCTLAQLPPGAAAPGNVL